MDFVKMPIISFQTKIDKELLDNMQNGIVEGITKAEEALTKIEKIDEGGGVSDEAIAEAVENYLEENPIDGSVGIADITITEV